MFNRFLKSVILLILSSAKNHAGVFFFTLLIINSLTVLIFFDLHSLTSILFNNELNYIDVKLELCCCLNTFLFSRYFMGRLKYLGSVTVIKVISNCKYIIIVYLRVYIEDLQ